MHLAAQEDQVPVAEILVRYHSEIDPQTKVIASFHCCVDVCYFPLELHLAVSEL